MNNLLKSKKSLKKLLNSLMSQLMDQENQFFPDIFILLTTLFKNKQLRVYQLLKSLHTQKPDQLKAFLDQNPALKSIIYKTLTSKYGSLQNELPIMLSVWYSVGFFIENEEENMKNFRLNNASLRDFLEEIAYTLDIEILYCDSHRQNIFDSPKDSNESSSPETKRFVILYDPSREKWHLRRNIPTPLLKDFKSSARSKVLPCNMCQKIVFFQRETPTIFEACGHLLCVDCGKSYGSKLKNKYCTFCASLFGDDEVWVCKRCRCGFPQESLVKCGKCKMMNCKLCFFRYGELTSSKNDDSGELLCSQCAAYK